MIREKTDQQVLEEAIEHEEYDIDGVFEVEGTHILLPLDVARRILEALRRQ